MNSEGFATDFYPAFITENHGLIASLIKYGGNGVSQRARHCLLRESAASVGINHVSKLYSDVGP